MNDTEFSISEKDTNSVLIGLLISNLAAQKSAAYLQIRLAETDPGKRLAIYDRFEADIKQMTQGVIQHIYAEFGSIDVDKIFAA